MEQIQKHRGIAITALLIALFFLTFSACKSFDNDPPEESGKGLVIDLREIKKQMGVPTASGASGISNSIYPEETEATSKVLGVVLGTMVVTKRDTPYTKETPLTDAVIDDIEKDLTNSISFIEFYPIGDLIGKDFIELPKTPPPTSGHWQVIVAGTNVVVEKAEDLEDEDDPIIYAGFSERFYYSDQIKENEEINVEMVRVCFVDNPAKGCATFDDKWSKDPIVTSAVEILGAYYTYGTSDATADVSTDVSFPIIVRSASDATNAISSLKTVRDLMKVNATENSHDVKSLTIRTTHSMNTTHESSACTALRNSNSVTVSQLETNCSVQLNKVPLAVGETP